MRAFRGCGIFPAGFAEAVIKKLIPPRWRIHIEGLLFCCWRCYRCFARCSATCWRSPCADVKHDLPAVPRKIGAAAGRLMTLCFCLTGGRANRTLPAGAAVLLVCIIFAFRNQSSGDNTFATSSDNVGELADGQHCTVTPVALMRGEACSTAARTTSARWNGERPVALPATDAVAPGPAGTYALFLTSSPSLIAEPN